MDVDVNGSSKISADVLAAQLATCPLALLAAAEAVGVVFMREEEQLAHDVHAVSAMLWAPPIFENISASEATHSASVKALVDRYQLVDPLAGLAAGRFKTLDFQALYDAMVAASRVRLNEALIPKVTKVTLPFQLRRATARTASSSRLLAWSLSMIRLT